MREREVVLVHPNNPGNYVQGTIHRENLGLGYLSSELKDRGFATDIVDSRITKQTPEEATREILALKPFLIGFSIMAKDATDWCEKVARYIKEEDKNIHIAMGNYFPSLQTDRAFESVPNADSAVIGEGDLTFPELASCIITGKDWQSTKGIAFRTKEGVQISRRELIKDLDELPFPEHYGPRFQLNEFAIEGSRGCYMKCTFCSISPFFNAESPPMRWRSRSPKSIADEIKETSQKYPDIRLFRFVDPDFVGAPKHADRLSEFVRELRNHNLNIDFIIDTRTNVVLNIPKALWRNLKDVGLREVYLGVETASPYIKRMMRKGSTIEGDKKAISLLNDLGIQTRFGFMMITPWTKENDIVFNAQVLRSLGFPRLEKYFQEMFLVPGTDAVDLAQRTTEIWWDKGGEGEYYAYGLPHPIDNLRRVSRSVVEHCLDFLEQFQRLHEAVRISELSLGENLGQYKAGLNDFSLDFFLTVFDGAKRLGANAPKEAIKDTAESIVKDYQSRLDKLEKDFYSRR